MRTKRDATTGQLKNHTETMKLLERDIYEINRKLDIVNAENCKFRLVSTLKPDSAPSPCEILGSFFISQRIGYGRC